MLVTFEVENFQSIRDRQVLDLRVPATTPEDPKRFMRLRDHSSVRVPRVVALFGPNASGKTTLLRAISAACDFLVNSFTRNEPEKGISIEPFASSDWMGKPTEFVLEYAPGSLFDDGVPLYRYELRIERIGATSYVSWEALRRSRGGVKFRTLFERTGDASKSVIKPFADLDISPSDPRLNVRTNVSVISSLVQFDHDLAKEIRRHFQMIIGNAQFGRFERLQRGITEYYQNLRPGIDPLKGLNDVIRTIDLGLDRVYLEEKDGKMSPMFVHKGLDVHQPLDSESQGTRNFYCLYPVMSLALLSGGTAIMDEIDSDIHPMLLPEMIRWFRTDRTNPHKGQLVMTCHAATMLEELMKEEVWFADKDQSGATRIYGAKEIANVNRRTNIYAKYLGGAFGALPQVG